MISIHHIFWYDPVSLKKDSINLEKSLSYESKSSTFHENVFNDVRRLTCQTFWLFLFQYERVSKSCMTNLP